MSKDTFNCPICKKERDKANWHIFKQVLQSKKLPPSIKGRYFIHRYVDQICYLRMCNKCYTRAKIVLWSIRIIFIIGWAYLFIFKNGLDINELSEVQAGDVVMGIFSALFALILIYVVVGLPIQALFAWLFFQPDMEFVNKHYDCISSEEEYLEQEEKK